VATADARPSKGETPQPGPPFTALTAAFLLALSALAIGVNSNGVRAGFFEALAVLTATAVFGRAAYNGTLPRPLNGSLGIGLIALLAGVSALSVGWSLTPNASMLDALRLVAYTSVLALSALLAQLHPQRSRELALGVLLATVVVSIYALGSRAFPGLYPGTDDFARIRLPFGYWNAVGTVSAIGVLLALWAGTRRGESRTVEILSYPAGGLLLAALMLSQSRGALLALLVGIGLWLLIAPRRLRSAGWIAAVAGLTGLLVAWAYAQSALTTDHMPLATRESAGYKLFFGLILLSAGLGACGWLICDRRHKRALDPQARRKTGKALLIALAVTPLLAVVIVSFGTDRGVSTFSDSASDFFSTSHVAPSNSPSRLTQTNSLRGRYWSESVTIFKTHTWHGTGSDTFGVARLPYRPDLLNAEHAHGMVPQTIADLGVLGLLALLGLMLVWLTAALKLFGAAKSAPWNWLTDSAGDEQRLAAVALAAAAVVFGVQSAIDWVWFMPGVAFFALVCGGWTLGHPDAHSLRQSHAATIPVRGGRAQTLRAAAIAVVGIVIAYGVIQPVRSAQKVQAGLTIADSEPARANELGRAAIDLDPTSAEAWMLVAVAQSNANNPRVAERTLVELAHRQPSNPATWLRLAEFRLTAQDPDGAIEALRPVFFLSRFAPQADALLAAARQMKADVVLEKLAEAKRKKLDRQLKQLEQLQRKLPG
jgi:O-antigen ligase